MIKHAVMSVCLLLLLSCQFVWAGSISSVSIAADEVKHRFEYSHYDVIGLCWWEKWQGWRPHFYTTFEVSEYKPDLVVTVYNQYGDDPWIEANTVVDNLSQPLSQTLYQAAMGGIRGASDEPLGEGNNATEMGHISYANLRTKMVDVIGSPLNTLALLVPQLDSDTTFLFPYYQSEMDTLGRMGIAEALRPETYEPIGHYIGQSDVNHWSYEFPRDMNVNVDNDFKADVILALRAADIVTNNNTLHTVKSTQDSCGKNCAVASVKENTVAQLDSSNKTFQDGQFNDKNPPDSLWQEVYPYDAPIQPGQNDALMVSSLGSKEESHDDGNMVFVIWRRYEGCVQHSGNLIGYTKKINLTVRR